MKAKISKLKSNRKTQIEEVKEFTKDILISAIQTKFQAKIDRIEQKKVEVIDTHLETIDELENEIKKENVSKKMSSLIKNYEVLHAQVQSLN